MANSLFGTPRPAAAIPHHRLQFRSPSMPKSLLFTSLPLFTVAMFFWHKIAVLIVTNYGIVGTVIACSVLIAASFIVDR
jgi:hypothetical protein